MIFEKLENQSLKDKFIQRIEDAILSGELEIGAKLPSERELVEQMQISRNVISVGLAELERMGFLEVRARQGVFVADYRKKGTMETFEAIVRQNGGNLQKNEIRSMLELCMDLHLMTVRLSIEKASDAELKGLDDYIGILRSADTNKAVANAIFELHHQISMISDNSLCPLVIYSFKPVMLSLYEKYCSRHGCEHIIDSKAAMVDAMKNRDFNTASDIITQLIGDTISGKTSIYSE